MATTRILPKAARVAAAGFVAALIVHAVDAHAAITWKGHSWNVTSGGMAGVAKGSPSNVSIDTDGYLHLRITNDGGTWTAAEVFSTDRLGFGTYQWQVDGPIDRFDKNVVLGLFPYGPTAGIGKDGTNEIDIEYSFWGHADGNNGDFTIYPASGTTVGELSYRFSLGGGTLSTSRFVWTKDRIVESLLSALQPVGSDAGLIKTWTYAPSNATMNLPQQPLPVGMNLWCFQATPSDGKNVEVVIRDFQFVAAGTAAGGSSGAGGMASSGGASAGGGMGSGGMSDAGPPNDGGGSGVAGSSSGGTSGNVGTSGSGPSNGGVTDGQGGATNTGGTSNVAAGGRQGGGATSSAAGGVGESTSATGGSANAASGCTCTVPAKPAVPRGAAFALFTPLLFAVRRRARKIRSRVHRG